ncbi:MAG: pilus assembly protein [Deltaproteobacteria bacterium]|nr:pilus assembly protein [Deltaproteobacteria bacterium]
MSWNCPKPHKLSPRDRESGVVAVEFIFLLPILLLIVVGIIEFGHLFAVRHTLTNASREGARAAVVYNDMVGTPARITFADTQAKAAVNKYLQDTQFAGAWTVTDTVAGSNSGDLVKVTVTAPGSLLLLDTFIPALKNVTVSAETTMRME